MLTGQYPFAIRLQLGIYGTKLYYARLIDFFLYSPDRKTRHVAWLASIIRDTPTLSELPKLWLQTEWRKQNGGARPLLTMPESPFFLAVTLFLKRFHRQTKKKQCQAQAGSSAAAIMRQHPYHRLNEKYKWSAASSLANHTKTVTNGPPTTDADRFNW